MSTDEKRVFKNAGPPKTQEQLELKCADSSGNGNGGVLFKSVYPSSHGNSTAQVAMSSEPRGKQKKQSFLLCLHQNLFSPKNIVKITFQ